MANIKATERMTSAQRKFGTSGTIMDGPEANFTNIPKAGYNFIVKFELSEGAKRVIRKIHGIDKQINLMAAFQVKETDKPNMTMAIETMNQYNKTRQSPGKITYDPLSMTFYDTIDSMALQLIDAYRYYYYGDFTDKGINSFAYDTISRPDLFEGFSGDDYTWGRSTMQQSNNNESYFFKRIDIFEIDGSQYTVHNIHNPVIESIDLGKKDHASEGEPQTISATFKYEGITNINPLNGKKAIGAKSAEIAPYLLASDQYGTLGFFKTWGEMDDPGATGIDPNEVKGLPDENSDFSFTSLSNDIIGTVESIDGLIGGFSDIWEDSSGFEDTATNLYNSVTTGNIGDAFSSGASSLTNTVKSIGGLF